MEKVTFRNCSKTTIVVYSQNKELRLFSGQEDWLMLPFGKQQIEI